MERDTMKDYDRVIAALNGLIETCRDAEEGLRAAANRVDEESTRDVLREYAEQRAGFADELELQLRLLGGEADSSGDEASDARRGWMSIRSAEVDGDHEILAETERSDDAVRQRFEEVLEEALPPHVGTIVERQWTEIQDAHTRFESLRDEGGAGRG